MFNRKFRRLFTKTLKDLEGNDYKPKSNVTVYMKDATTACNKCGGPCAVFGDTNSYGILERLYLKCPKCGEGYTLTSRQPDNHEEVQALIKKGALR